jgi:hypothetical protein
MRFILALRPLATQMSLATTGGHFAQICFSSLTRKFSIYARIAMLCRSESLALLVLGNYPDVGVRRLTEHVQHAAMIVFLATN